MKIKFVDTCTEHYSFDVSSPFHEQSYFLLSNDIYFHSLCRYDLDNIFIHLDIENLHSFTYISLFIQFSLYVLAGHKKS